MKTNILLIAMLTLGVSTFQAQAQTTVYAKNSDISDNLDLRAVASIFGESSNLQDFERRLNDPKYQISNLDLNDDNDVDYLRVIESVENRTHVVIIQAVLDRDVYQDIATIDVERDNSNKVSVQVVGNTYLYGDNYIYEPVYHVTPVIYTSFWVTNYRPYYSSWTWNIYPTYYYAWRPYPIYRYRNNINVCINVNNNYNYVNHRRSYRAPAIYETRRTYGYEKMRPNYGFSQRNSNVNNRYELDQRRVASRESRKTNDVYNNSGRYNTNRQSSSMDNKNGNRNYSEARNNSDRSNSGRGNSDRNYNSNRMASNRDNAAKGNTPVKVETPRRAESPRGYNDNNMNSSRGNSENRNNSNRIATAPRTETQKSEAPRTETPRSYSENRGNSVNRGNYENRGNSVNRGNSENRSNTSTPQATQRAEAPRSQESRGNQGSRESSSPSRGGGRRI